MEAEQEQQLQELQDAWLQMKEQPRRKRARKAKPQETSLPPSQAEPDDVARSGNEPIYLAFIAFLFDPAGWLKIIAHLIVTGCSRPGWTASP